MMAKEHSTTATITSSQGRVAKKARIARPPKDTISPKKSSKFRVKGSPRPTAKTKSTASKGKQKAADEKPAISLPSTFKVVAGSYEKLLYGLEGSAYNEDGHVKFDLKPVFIFPAHVSSIKSVAASPGGGKWLATGSTDEIVKVWDLRRKKEIGGLMHHNGSITSLLFPSRSHLVSSSEDGTIGIFHARDWSVLRTLRGHKARVNCVDVHPSGKVALSVGKDRMLRMWDMMRGRGVASVKLGKEGEIVRWSTDGGIFAVQSGKEIDIYGTDMSLLHNITHPSRLHDIKFCKNAMGKEVLLVAAEDKKVSVYDFIPLPDGDEDVAASEETVNKGIPPRVVAEMVGHENRIKALQTLSVALPAPPSSDSTSSHRTSTTILSTVSSDGKIHIYDLYDLPEPETENVLSKIKEIHPVAVYDTKGTRLTCVTLAEGDVNFSHVVGEEDGSDNDEAGPNTGEKRKHDSDAEDKEEEGNEWGGVSAEDEDEDE